MKNWPLLRCLLLYREMPLRFLITASLFIAVNLTMPYQQWLIGRAVNEVGHGAVVVRLADGRLDFTRAWHWLGLLVGVAAARGVVQYCAGIVSMTANQALQTTLRDRIIVQVQRLDLAYHWRHGVGELVTRTTRDADKIRDALIQFWRQVFETLLVLVASVGMLCWYAPLLGIVPLLVVVAGFAILVTQTGSLVALDRAVGAAYDAVNQDLTEGINGVRVIKAFGLEAARTARFDRQVLIFAAESRLALAYAARRVPVPQMVIALGHVWVLGYGAVLVGSGRLNVGELVAALLVANTLVLRVEGIGRVMQVFADARSSAGRIWDLLDAQSTIRSGDSETFAESQGIRAEHVRVASPDGGSDILRDLSFRIEPGELVALVGTTGSGKSTLMGLLPRLVDADDGTVSIGSSLDGWRDIRGLDIGQLRRCVHVVPQESFLFSDTIAGNLRLSAPDASDEDLHAALRLAAAEDILNGRPEGLETRVGDRGVTLSGGQRQRLCLARALLANARILGLDDATSALDAVTERRVLDNIRQLRQTSGRVVTVLIASSKLSTILLCDRILLLANGHIAAEGTHVELATSNADYRDLMGI